MRRNWIELDEINCRRFYFSRSDNFISSYYPVSPIQLASVNRFSYHSIHGATVVLTSSFVNFVLTLLGTLVIICMVIIFFSVRLKRVNRELKERNKQILDINNDLQKINGELEVQKEQITKEYYESDKFYRMVVQSADDGISFFDKDWNLKFANSAFYSLIGYDKG